MGGIDFVWSKNANLLHQNHEVTLAHAVRNSLCRPPESGEALAPYLKKGTAVTVFGSLTLREWTNKEGHKQLSPDIRIDEITLHGGRDTGAMTEAPVQQNTSSPMPPPSNDTDWDDPPF